jgi:hypothetical protein
MIYIFILFKNLILDFNGNFKQIHSIKNSNNLWNLNWIADHMCIRVHQKNIQFYRVFTELGDKVCSLSIDMNKRSEICVEYVFIDFAVPDLKIIKICICIKILDANISNQFFLQDSHLNFSVCVVNTQWLFKSKKK